MTRKNLYKRLTQTTIDTIYNENERQQMHFRWTLKFLFALASISAVMNYIEHYYMQSLGLLIIAILCFGCYWIIYLLKDKGVICAKVIISVAAIIASVHILLIDSGLGFPSFWILIFPGLTLFLMGRNAGTILSLSIFGVAVIVIFINPSNLLPEYLPAKSYAIRLLLAYLFILIIAFFSETIRLITVTQLRESRERLDRVYQQTYSNLQEKIEATQRARHDIRHHFVYIESLLQSGKSDEALEYVEEKTKSMQDSGRLVFCQNYAANSFLAYHAERAKQNNIAYDVKANIPANLPITDTDLVGLLGNLIENAIEASLFGKSMSDSFEPAISIKCNYTNGMFFLSIMNNSIRLAEQDSNNRYLSSKHEGYGIGIGSVRSIVDRYNGTLQITQDDGKFTVNIALYLN